MVLRSIIIFLVSVLFTPSWAVTYYVDFTKGKDENNGLSPANAWKSLTKVNSYIFSPGDTVCFRRGSVWTGQLNINKSGTKSDPIIFTAYDQGANPTIKNPGVNHGSAIRISADWIIVENFIVREAHDSGITIFSGAEYNIIRNNEATLVGIGIAVRGRHNLITGNYAHDLTMVVNTQGGDDDYGSVGIWLFASNNEISYNRMLNCISPSFDYGFDGGMVEFYGDVDSCYIHHNRGENCDGAFEVGGQGETLTDNLVAYNISVNNKVSGGFHVGGNFGVLYENFRVENNIFVDTASREYSVGFWNGKPDTSNFIYRNNIFYIPNHQHISNNPGFTHQNNLYYMGGRTDTDFSPGPGDKTGDPMFVNFSEKDFHLMKGSPAIDAGTIVDYPYDFDRNPVPAGLAPDIGAYEFMDRAEIPKE